MTVRKHPVPIVARLDSPLDYARAMFEARFWAKVQKEPGDGCWRWLASTGKHGYGHFAIGHELYLSHRVSWELEHGPIAEGLLVLHKCIDSPECVRPSHLYLGTQVENMKDRVAQGKVWRRYTTTPHGTHTGYTHHKCRCPPCVDFHNAYRRERYAVKKRASA